MKSPAQNWEKDVHRRKDGRLINNIHNAITILGEDSGWEGLLAYQFIGPGHRLPKGALTNRFLHNRESDGGYVVTLRGLLANEQGWDDARVAQWQSGAPITAEELTMIQRELQMTGLHKCGRKLIRQAVLFVAMRNCLPPPPP